MDWSDRETGALPRDVQISHRVTNDGERLVFPAECFEDSLWAELVEIAMQCFEEVPGKRPMAGEVAARLP
jgi:hypothetical protein